MGTLDLEERAALSRKYIDHLDQVLGLRARFEVDQISAVGVWIEVNTPVVIAVDEMVGAMQDGPVEPNNQAVLLDITGASSAVHRPLLEALGLMGRATEIRRVDVICDKWKPRAIINVIGKQQTAGGDVWLTVEEVNLEEEHLHLLDHLKEWM